MPEESIERYVNKHGKALMRSGLAKNAECSKIRLGGSDILFKTVRTEEDKVSAYADGRYLLLFVPEEMTQNAIEQYLITNAHKLPKPFRVTKEDKNAKVIQATTKSGIAYQIIRTSKSDRIELRIVKGIIEVRAPHYSENQQIDEFVEKHKRWIKNRLQTSSEKVDGELSLNFGDYILYRGHLLRITSNKSEDVHSKTQMIIVRDGLSSNEIKQAIMDTYKKEAKRIIGEKLVKFAPIVGTTFLKHSISSATKRWGSCTTNKTLSFSWYIMMADDALIDYVVVHELAHCLEPNHSSRFWAIVERVIPNYKECTKKLKEIHRKLAAEGWF
jgi:predicted metal-dependent hydrolase